MTDELIKVSESRPHSLNINHKSGSYSKESAEEKQKAFNALMDHTLSNVLSKSIEHNDRISLKDTDAVKKRAEEYMEACKRAGAYPTLMGFSAALGLARKTVWEFCSKHSEHESARLIQRLQSAWADLMTQMAMRRQCAEVMSIFLLKNSGQGLTDHQTVEISPKNNDEFSSDNMDENALRQRYYDYIAVDEGEEINNE